MELIETINLANGLYLNIFDLSRLIAADTVKVAISIQIEIALNESYFSSSQDYHLVKSFFGDKLIYEHKLERSFVPCENQLSVCDKLISTFKSNSLNYLAAVNFPKSLALSRLRDIKNHPYKYISKQDTKT